MFKKTLIAALTLLLSSQSFAILGSEEEGALYYSAPIVVNPHIGKTGSFGWNWVLEDLNKPFSNSWIFEPILHDQKITFKLEDEMYPGDNFDKLYLNGSLIPWDIYTYGTGNRYVAGNLALGEVNLSLLAGNTYKITFLATPCDAGGCTLGGGGTYTITPTPEPETWAMMLVGLGFAVSTARRKKTA